MRPRTAAEFSALTDELTQRTEHGGYAVSVFRRGDYVEMHAVQLKLPCAQHIATVWDGDGEEHLYRYAIERARMLTIEAKQQGEAGVAAWRNRRMITSIFRYPGAKSSKRAREAS